ncbi:MAG TPA: DUF2512 family protein [Bacillota bacterium]|nr:DUF2512 family protein [Bacillota bacterium]
MSKTTGALITKFLLTLVSAYLAFNFVDNNSFGWLFTLSVAATILNYVIGDLFLLPRIGNFLASVADGGLAALTAAMLGNMVQGNNTGRGSLWIFALLIAVAEYFFHRYLLQTNKVEPNT